MVNWLDLSRIAKNSRRSNAKQTIFRRIYTTFIVGTALQNFGTRANSFGHGPLDLHDKICSCFLNVDFWNGTAWNKNGTLKFVSPCTYMTAVHMWFQARLRPIRRAFADSRVQKAIVWLVASNGSLLCLSQLTKQGHPGLAPLSTCIKAATIRPAASYSGLYNTRSSQSNVRNRTQSLD